MFVVPVEKGVDWKRPPIVLISIVLLNIAIFLFYQSDDQRRLADAVQSYHHHGLLDMEWKAYKAYERRKNRKKPLRKSDEGVHWYIVADHGFNQFIAEHYKNYINPSRVTKWRRARAEVERYSSQVSINAYGLDSNNLEPFDTISYQFLHGSVMHIVGNLVFLVLTGFAVEAALGSLRFLCFYLIAGIGSGLLFAVLQMGGGGSGGNLVGASGSISGVVAMYVVIFGMRKIQFFYWFLVFTGYFRAAAIVMLPIYISFEFYNLMTNEGSNVAYMAHVGGFITGAALVWLNKSIDSSSVDESYLEPEEVIKDPYAEKMQALYQNLARCEFEKAWKQQKEMKQDYSNRQELVDIEYQLVRALNDKKIPEYLMHRVGKPGNSRKLTIAILDNWRKASPDLRAKINFERKSQLVEEALNQGLLEPAEHIFNDLKNEPQRELDVAVLAKRIAVFCQQSSKPDKFNSYNDFALSLSSGGAQ